MVKTAYEAANLQARMDIARKKRDLKKVRCKPGYELRGAVCQKIKPKKSTKLNKTHPLVKFAAAFAAGTAVVGVGQGLGKINLSESSKKALKIGLTDAQSLLGRKLPKKAQRETAAYIEEAEKAYDAWQETSKKAKQPPLVQQLAKEVFLQTSAGIVGSIAGSIASTGGKITGIGIGSAANRSTSTTIGIGAGVGALFEGYAQLKARRATLKALEQRFGTGIKNRKLQQKITKYSELFEVSTQVAWSAAVFYAEAHQQARQQTYQSSTASNVNQNWYQDLGVKPNATPEEVKKAYREKAKQSHPDVGGNVEDFRKINEAYEYYQKTYGRS